MLSKKFDYPVRYTVHEQHTKQEIEKTPEDKNSAIFAYSWILGDNEQGFMFWVVISTLNSPDGQTRFKI